MIEVDLRSVKAEAARFLPAGHPGREGILALPDYLPGATFDALVPVLIRLVRATPPRGAP